MVQLTEYLDPLAHHCLDISVPHFLIHRFFHLLHSFVNIHVISPSQVLPKLLLFSGRDRRIFARNGRRYFQANGSSRTKHQIEVVFVGVFSASETIDFFHLYTIAPKEVVHIVEEILVSITPKYANITIIPILKREE